MELLAKISKQGEDFFQISQDKRYYVSKSGKVFSTISNKIIKPFKNTNGYWQFQTGNYPHRKKYLLHRIMAELFLEKPKAANLEACFKNSNPDDIYLENIEWLKPVQKNFKTLKRENYKTCEAVYKPKGDKPSRFEKKPVLQLKNDVPVKIWESMYEVQKVLNINGAGISQVCKGYRKKAGGFSWQYL